MKRKVYVDEDGNISTVEIPDNATAIVDPPPGSEIYEVPIKSEKHFREMESMAKKEKKASKKLVKELQESQE